jgi:hypothetical protein
VHKVGALSDPNGDLLFRKAKQSISLERSKSFFNHAAANWHEYLAAYGTETGAQSRQSNLNQTFIMSCDTWFRFVRITSEVLLSTVKTQVLRRYGGAIGHDDPTVCKSSTSTGTSPDSNIARMALAGL